MKTLLPAILMVTACTSGGDSKSDSTTPPMAASDVQFDNASSGLASTNVQDALDDVIAMAQAQQEQASTSVITCRFASANVTIPSMGSLGMDKAIYPHAFNANECGGTLPDASYVGTLSRMSICNEINGAAAMNSGEPDGPGVQLRTWGGCTGPAEIVAVFFKR